MLGGRNHPQAIDLDDKKIALAIQGFRVRSQPHGLPAGGRWLEA